MPVLVAEADLKSIDLRADAEALPSHDCAHVGIAAIDAALARDDRILELGAGCGANGAPNIVRTDAFVWRSSSSPGAVDAGHPSAAQRPAPGSLSATGRGDALA